jgi:hypothetical protein
VPHSTCTHRGRVESRLFVVGSQTANLTPGPSFDHNLCYRCPNGSCEDISDIYTSKPFQRYNEHLKARYFDLCNRALKSRESQRTPSSHFWEYESHPHTYLKVGLRQIMKRTPRYVIIIKGHPNLINMHSYKKFVVTIVILALNAIASTHLVA